MNKKISVISAGRWGTTIAIYLSMTKKFEVSLYCHSKEEFEYINTNNESPFLKGYPLNDNITPVNELNDTIEKSDIIVIATPVPFLRKQLESISVDVTDKIFVGVNKGIENDTFMTVPEIMKEYFPNSTIAQLGGPSFPDGLIKGRNIVAETLACEDLETGKFLQGIFSSDRFRVYLSDDLKGVAILGALKNIYAIISGVMEGFGLSEEATAILITRALAEIRRLCEIYDIKTETIHGLSGLGDLVLTCYSNKNSHNKNLGIRLGRGETIDEIFKSLEHSIPEGYFTLKAFGDELQKLNIELPLIDTAYDVVFNSMSVKESIMKLMNRPLKIED